MAVTAYFYNHTAKKLLNKEVTYTTLKVMLVNATAVANLNLANTTLAQVLAGAADEVSGNGWAAGGETLANFLVTTVTTNDAKMTGDQIAKTATGGDIGAAYGAVIYDDTDASDAPLFFYDFGGAFTAGVGTQFLFTPNANGIVSGTV
jgi:hypothetical protein